MHFGWHPTRDPQMGHSIARPKPRSSSELHPRRRPPHRPLPLLLRSSAPPPRVPRPSSTPAGGRRIGPSPPLLIRSSVPPPRTAALSSPSGRILGLPLETNVFGWCPFSPTRTQFGFWVSTTFGDSLTKHRSKISSSCKGQNIGALHPLVQASAG